MYEKQKVFIADCCGIVFIRFLFFQPGHPTQAQPKNHDIRDIFVISCRIT